MTADLTRVTFNPLQQFSAVLMQQGRVVQLDAYLNQQSVDPQREPRRDS